MDKAAFSDLVGKTLVAWEYKDELILSFSDGTAYMMYHEQECCESVTLEDVCGDPTSLFGDPLVQAFEKSEYDEDSSSGTWTFYTLATKRASVTLRWYGESNGYYSEDVDFKQVRP